MKSGRDIESQTEPNHGEDNKEQNGENKCRLQDFRATLALGTRGGVRKSAAPDEPWLVLMFNSLGHSH
jgi:hypothetical protein